MSVSEILRLLFIVRLPLTSEKVTQEALSEALDGAGIIHDREVGVLASSGGRQKAGAIDFLCDDGIGIEVKLKGGRRDIYRQCVRYCSDDKIKTLIVATSVALSMPAEINGKPVFVQNLGEAWL